MLLLLLPVPSLPAQGKVEVTFSGVQPAQVKLGEYATVEITVKGTQEAKLVQVPEVEGLRFTAGQPSRRSFISFDGFRRVQEVSLVYTIRIDALKKGTFRIPPFVVSAGGNRWKTEPETLKVVEDFLGRKLGWLEVEASQEIAWVHQPVRVTARFGVSEEVYAKLFRSLYRQRNTPFELHLPWMDDQKMSGTVVMEEKERGSGKERVNVVVNKKKTIEAVSLGIGKRGDRSFHFFELSRTFLPTDSGILRFGAGILQFKLMTRIGRDLFGNPVVEELTACTVPGKPLTVKVRTFPEEGRPEDYSGAVGRFEVSANASPRDVRVGESIKLNLVVEGEGNLGFFPTPKLPPLEGFRLYGTTEEKVGDLLRVTYDIAPLDEGVDRIPALPFSYFDTDPEVEGYRTVRTGPIPIKVRPLPEGAGLQELEERRPKVTPGVDDIMDLKLFDPAASLPPPDRVSPWLPAAGLGGPLLLWVAFLLWWRVRRRRLADPAGVRRRTALGRLRAALAEAEGAAAVANVFHRFLADLWRTTPAAVEGGGWRPLAEEAGLEKELRSELAALSEELDRCRFCPAGEVAEGRLKECILALGRELDRWEGGA